MMLLPLVAGLAMAVQLDWVEQSKSRLELREDGRTVFVFNHGPERECCYLHPVNSPSGVTVTDDGPADHKHHRGIFWAWPIVRVGETQADLWLQRDAKQRFERFSAKAATEGAAGLVIEQGWFVKERRVVHETVELVIRPSANGRQEFDVTLTLVAVDQPVEIAGAPEQNKGYGGFSCRFAPRAATAISTSEGPVTRDEDHGRHTYAELAASFDGRRAGLRITAAQPGEWCLRPYGFVGATFPGVQPHTLLPGKPLTLRYSVTVFDGSLVH
jgi:hypothetical protein